MNDPIVVERLIAAPPSVVYSYLTDSEKWARWQGEDATIRPERGGIFSISMSNGTRARGEFVEVDPGRRVVFTWGWVDHPGVPPGSTTVEIELMAEGHGTRLRLTHHGLPPEEVPIHTQGWEYYSGRLVTVAEGGDPGPDAVPSDT
ncbi:MAG: SRPBCC family protein [Acidimicrobiia bacterium]